MSIEIVHDVLPLPVARAAVAMFPGPSWDHWHKYDSANSQKYASIDACRIPRACLAALDSLAYRKWATVAESAFPDIDFHAAGLHMIPPDGFLGRHIDARKHPLKPWIRAYSVVWFANSGDVGVLRIGDQEISPQFNTAVCFECSDTSWHEVTPNTSDQFRKTLSVFFWRLQSVDDEIANMNTSAVFT